MMLWRVSRPQKRQEHEVKPLSRTLFEAEFLQTFEGPHPGKLFIDRGDEIRLPMTINIDFFVVEGLTLRGSKGSCGLISGQCLALPSQLRIQTDNMYCAGVVCGPEEPNDDQLNHYTRILINDFKESWERGVHVSRTACNPRGALTRSAIICSVCDLPGGRKAAGLTRQNHRQLCSVCGLICEPKKYDQTWRRTDYEDWPRRSSYEMRKQAKAYRDAASEEERAALFAAHGVRWSEFWNLPYWDVTRQLVVDSMHCILEGLAHHHFRNVLGLAKKERKETKNESTAGENILPDTQPAFRIDEVFTEPRSSVPVVVGRDGEQDRCVVHNEKSIKDVHKIHRLLSQSYSQIVDDVDMEDHLKTLTEKVSKCVRLSLLSVCDDLRLRHEPDARKSDLAALLVDWVREPCNDES